MQTGNSPSLKVTERREKLKTLLDCFQHTFNNRNWITNPHFSPSGNSPSPGSSTTVPISTMDGMWTGCTMFLVCLVTETKSRYSSWLLLFNFSKYEPVAGTDSKLQQHQLACSSAMTVNIYFLGIYNNLINFLHSPFTHSFFLCLLVSSQTLTPR